MKTIRIGRLRNENDVVLIDENVSRHHAILEWDEHQQKGMLRDLGSTQGTYVNGSKEKITSPTTVSLSDTVRFAKTTMTVEKILKKAGETVVILVPPSDPNSRTIGKSKDNSIVMTQDDVSRHHAKLYQKPDGSVVIEDVGSTNGTFVNGDRVTSRVLKAGDRVTITRKYPLDWEHIFKPKPQKKTHSLKALRIVAAVFIVAALLGGGALWVMKNKTWSQERIYEEYHSAVCCVVIDYGYRIMLDGEDVTKELFRSDFVHIGEDGLEQGFNEKSGTGFFISEDGKLATNLHVVRPWLFENDAESIRDFVEQSLIRPMSQYNPAIARTNIEVKAVMVNIGIIPDGLPFSESNFVECSEYECSDDVEKDVAVIQTKNRQLPSQVKKIIDVKNADASDEAVKEGKTIFAIGYPYTNLLGLNNREEMKNQVHDGKVTQNRGSVEFGHDIATASGASGSPILNDKGRLVGVHHAGMTGVTGAQGFNMGIKVKYLIDLLK